jgi:hypothetical protein
MTTQVNIMPWRYLFLHDHTQVNIMLWGIKPPWQNRGQYHAMEVLKLHDHRG